MKKFDGILIATDLDGTLLRNDKTISEENLSAIEYFKENGGIFTFVTGRSATVVGYIYDLVRPNAPIGAFNGGAVIDAEKGEFISKHILSRDALELVRLVDKKMPGMSIQLCGFENSYFCKTNDAMERHIVTGRFRDLRCHYTEVKEDLAKILFAHSEEAEILKLRKLLETHPLSEKFQFVRSDFEFLEILPKGLSKGENLVKIAEIAGVDTKRTIGIGDNENDISLIEKAGIGIAVSNASEIAKKYADIITVSNEENAIARIIKELEEGKISLEV